jgi:hypothetical protein
MPRLRASAAAERAGKMDRKDHDERLTSRALPPHFVTELCQQTTDPGGVHPGLQRDPAARHASEYLAHGFPGVPSHRGQGKAVTRTVS